LLAPGGVLVLELGAGQLEAVAAFSAAAGLALAAPCRADLSGTPRALALRLQTPCFSS
jgi:release factor glutamine methyltransferase